jgi:hypothetical protein
VHKLKSATPNLRVINLYGINFVDDSHIDAFSSNCIQVNFDSKTREDPKIIPTFPLPKFSAGMPGRQFLQQGAGYHLEDPDPTIEAAEMLADERNK